MNIVRRSISTSLLWKSSAASLTMFLEPIGFKYKVAMVQRAGYSS
jgi:hypothetical protein